MKASAYLAISSLALALLAPPVYGQAGGGGGGAAGGAAGASTGGASLSGAGAAPAGAAAESAAAPSPSATAQPPSAGAESATSAAGRAGNPDVPAGTRSPTLQSGSAAPAGTGRQVFPGVDSGRRATAEAGQDSTVLPGQRTGDTTLDSRARAQQGLDDSPLIDGSGAVTGQTEVGADGRVFGLQFDNTVGDRLVVRDVPAQSLWRSAGLLPGDVLMSVNGQPVTSQELLVGQLRGVVPGARIPVTVLRNGTEVPLNIQWQREVRAYTPRADRVADDYGPGYRDDRGWLGVYLDMRYDDYAVVEAVEVGSAADRAGIRAGDWIMGINGQPVRSPAHLSQLIRGLEPGTKIDVEVAQRKRTTMGVELGARPDSSGRFRYEDGTAGEAQSARPQDSAPPEGGAAAEAASEGQADTEVEVRGDSEAGVVNRAGDDATLPEESPTADSSEP